MASSLNNLIKLANNYVNADTKNLDGFRRYLTTWYCFKFNVSFKDPTFLSHTFEELVLLYLMHDLRDNPSNYDKILGNKEVDDYEEWVKKQMGDDYLTDEEMVAQMVDYTTKEQELAKKLPDKITTDFSNFEANDE